MDVINVVRNKVCRAKNKNSKNVLEAFQFLLNYKFSEMEACFLQCTGVARFILVTFSLLVIKAKKRQQIVGLTDD